MCTNGHGCVPKILNLQKQEAGPGAIVCQPLYLTMNLCIPYTVLAFRMHTLKISMCFRNEGGGLRGRDRRNSKRPQVNFYMHKKNGLSTYTLLGSWKDCNSESMWKCLGQNQGALNQFLFLSLPTIQDYPQLLSICWVPTISSGLTELEPPNPRRREI